jgi:hypothetical protein
VITEELPVVAPGATVTAVPVIVNDSEAGGFVTVIVLVLLATV